MPPKNKVKGNNNRSTDLRVAKSFIGALEYQKKSLLSRLDTMTETLNEFRRQLGIRSSRRV